MMWYMYTNGCRQCMVGFQAVARIFRTGQTEVCHIHHLLYADTVEETMYEHALRKERLGGLVIDKGPIGTHRRSKVSAILPVLRCVCMCVYVAGGIRGRLNRAT
jgi:hypothetical protein